MERRYLESLNSHFKNFPWSYCGIPNHSVVFNGDLYTLEQEMKKMVEYSEIQHFSFLHSFVAMANVCNVTLMRFNELWEGIEVMDRNGKTVGTSLIAAKMVCTHLFQNKT